MKLNMLRETDKDTLKVQGTTFVVLEGYANSKDYYTQDKTIQSKCSHKGGNILSYKNTTLHIRKSRVQI